MYIKRRRINVGDGTMVDSHALDLHCAQIGKELPHFGRESAACWNGWRAAGDRRRRTVLVGEQRRRNRVVSADTGTRVRTTWNDRRQLKNIPEPL